MLELDNPIPGPIRAVIVATEAIAEKHGNSKNYHARAMTTIEALWDQGYVITEASHHLLGHAILVLIAVTTGFMLGIATEINGLLPWARIFMWTLGIAAGWLAHGVLTRPRPAAPGGRAGRDSAE